MKIGIDGRYAEGRLTGIGKYIRQLVFGLSSRGIEVVLFYSKKPVDEITGNNIYSVILYSKNRYLFEQILLPKALKREKIKLYHAAGNIGVPLFCPCPSVLTVHDIIPLLYPNYFSFSKTQLISKNSYLLRSKLSILRANKVITDSQFTKDSLVKIFKISPSRISVIPLGIDFQKGGGELPKGITKNKYILNHGGIDIRKNLFRLLEAFAKILPKYPELKLVITGGNETLRPKLEELSQKLGVSKAVVFTGYVDDKILWNLIKNANSLCLPSEIEGFGLPVLEGLAAGVPVVASNISSIPEVAGEAAILVNPNDINEIAEGLEVILTDSALRESLIKKGLSQAKKFSWTKTVEETIKIYKEVLK